ncbi:hypothetical protein [Longimicrobium sp.]|uniref:hypothetical protein n=1 Tax=Longimicrobium sp. TaxID=2029185 RepID=UPI002E336FDD|nr:hypothetical protein [Longimicrobium sp.]HEX6040657.1 hypothetical protein [Longimicrobium sp.]
MTQTGSEIALQPTVLTYDTVIATGSGPADIPTNIQAGTTFSAPFIVNLDNQAFLTTNPEQNFVAQEQVQLVGTRLTGWASVLPFTATVYGQPRVVERVILGLAGNPGSEPALTSRMQFQGGCIVGTGPVAGQLADPSPA